jgi:hypothetical protein
MGKLRNDLLEQLQPLSRQLRDDGRQPGDVAGGSRQARDEPGRNRVTGRRHDDGDGPRSLLGRLSIGIETGDDHVNLETDEIGRKVRETLGSSLRVSELDVDVLPLDPSDVREALPECLVPGRDVPGRG